MDKFILLFAYIVGTSIFWRKSTFSQPRKALFSLTVIPLLFVAMLFNIWLTDNFLPELMYALSSAQTQDALSAAQGLHLRSAEKAEAEVALVISTPIALLITYCWYALFRALERKSTGKKAFSLYKKVADNGDANAQYMIAQMYQAGNGVAPDQIQAFKYFRKAADNDHEQAQFSLANIYENGLMGIRQNYKQALYWYSRLAFKNNPIAEFRLGNFYKLGRGTREDVDRARIYFAKAAEHGHEAAKAELENLPPSVPFNEERHEQGNLRDLYDAVMDYKGERVWEDVFLEYWPRLQQVQSYFAEIKHRKCVRHPWPELLAGESLNLYCASRLSDTMLLRFQDGDVDPWCGPAITLENYIEFFEFIGFKAETPTRFHPFWCEVVEVTESDVPSIEITDVIWPALTLGNMMFSRSGVKVKAPKKLLVKGIADQSDLYWSYRRKYRKSIDLSQGWGHNSQWSTDLRRDFDLGDRYAYNVDGSMEKKDLRVSFEDDDGMGNMNTDNRIQFLKYRCLTNFICPDQFNFWPYDDYFEESKDDLLAA